MKNDLPFYTTTSQNLIRIHHLKDLITRLRSRGPEVLFFRGISLHGDVYPALGDREMLDVDILVREQDMGQLKKTLKGMGLKEIEPGAFSKPGFLLDLHTSFLNLSRTTLERSCLTIAIDEIFKRGVIKELEGLELKIPCPVHLFISTAVHLQSHSFASQKGWEDLVRIKEYYKLSDEAILAEAKTMGAERTLAYLNFLRPDLFPSWKGKVSFGARWILKRIKKGRFNQNFGDLLFLFQAKKKNTALKEIFFPHGISGRIIVDRLRKTFLLLRTILLGSRAQEITDRN